MPRRGRDVSSHIVFTKKEVSISNLYPFAENPGQLCALSVSSKAKKEKTTTVLTVFDVEIGKQTFSICHPLDIPFPLTCATVLDSNVLVAGTETGSVFGISTTSPAGEQRMWQVHCEGVELCTALATNSNKTLLACGVKFASVAAEDSDDETSNTGIVFYDLRSNPPSMLGAYKESHGDVVNCLAFDSVDSDILYTGGSDSLVNVFDLKQGCEDDALQFTFNCVCPVASIGNWKLDEKPCLFATTDDGRLFSWFTENGDDVIAVDAKTLLQIEDSENLFLVDCFDVSSSKGTENSLFAAATSPNGRLAVSRISPRQKEGIPILRGLSVGHNDMIRCLSWNDNGSFLYTGADDGTIVCSDLSTVRAENEPAKKRMK